MIEAFRSFLDRYEYWIIMPLVIYMVFLAYKFFKGELWKDFKDEVLRKGE